MSLPSPVLRVEAFATSRESKVHFGLLWVRPGTIAVNVTVTWMERELNACQTLRSMYTHIYLQPFPSNSTRKFRSSPF